MAVPDAGATIAPCGFGFDLRLLDRRLLDRKTERAGRRWVRALCKLERDAIVDACLGELRGDAYPIHDGAIVG